MTDLTISVDPSRGAKNPYERALWVVSGALVIGAVAAILWAQDVFSRNTGGWSEQPPTEIQIAQMIHFIAPSAISGGTILGGMALTFRALTLNLRTPDSHVVPSSGAAPLRDPQFAATVPAAPEKDRIASIPVDHTPYMRPQSSK